ncbi:hypothetical protein [Streptomyces prasinus]|uniref:hypothetical protein n=1 Tax=Streptomyces prasinus TaxID=67345 RepID=UPI0036A14BC4
MNEILPGLRCLHQIQGGSHFEGRNYSGWHRHTTLASLAQAFCTLLRLDPKAPAPA